MKVYLFDSIPEEVVQDIELQFEFKLALQCHKVPPQEFCFDQYHRMG